MPNRNSESRNVAAIRTAEPIRLDLMNVGVGIALSLLLHGMLVALSWNLPQPGAKKLSNQIRPVLEVRLSRPLPPPLTIPPEPPKTKPMQPSAIRKLKPTTKQYMTPNHAVQSEPQALTSPPQAAPEKHLDMDAIHASIAAAVAEVDREKRDTPVGQLSAKPLYAPDTETKLGRAIANGARPDCKDNQAGLLGPLLMLMDRKNSGCKW